MWRFAFIVLGLCLSACSRSAVPSVASADAGAVAADAGTPAAELTAQTVERYVRYQNALAPLYATLGQAVDRPEKGKGQLQAEARALVQLREAARLEEKARQEAGLTEAQVVRLDAMVTELVLARRMAKVSVGGEALRRLEALVDKLPEEQKAPLAQSLEERRRRQKELSELTELRRKYGGRDVELLLKQEEPLIQGHQKLTEQLLGPGAEETQP